MNSQIRLAGRQPAVEANWCEHRTVSRDGRIVCDKIGAGDNSVTPDLCEGCPFRAVNCQHLQFLLEQRSPSALVVRCNGRTEIWDDGHAEIRFRQAACSTRLVPIRQPHACAGCPLRQPLVAAAAQTGTAARTGKVVPFHRGATVEQPCDAAAASA